MKKLYFCIVFLLAALCLNVANAQSIKFNPFIEKSLSQSALNNITKAESVFCYTVDMASENYTGYTLNQMALTGFCGVLQREQSDLFVNEFFSKESSVSTTSSNCVISPRFMLRFYRGIDSTDVLFSYPCPSFSVFYGGRVQSFNAEPSSDIIEALSSVFDKNPAPFVSPALLDQLAPMGLASTDEQKALVAKQNQPEPVRNWAKTDEKEQDTKQESGPKGWNKLSGKK